MNITQEAPFENHFHLADGKIIKSIAELIDEIPKMREWVFAHHVNNERNDFANWIEHIFKQKTIAKKVKKAKSKEKIIEALKQETTKPEKKQDKKKTKKKKTLKNK